MYKRQIADRLKAFFLQKNITSALINLGGNVLAVGQKPDGTAFRTGIKKPFSETNELVDIVALKDQSLVSSGNYERCFRENGVLYHHILDPRTGYPCLLYTSITHAKQLLRFTDFTIEKIGIQCGMKDANYFSRMRCV